MYDSDPYELHKYLLTELSKKNLMFVEIKRHSKMELTEGVNGTDLDEQGRVLPTK